MFEKWYKRLYRRNFRDTHIADWDDKFLSEYDVERIMDTVTLSRGTAVTVFANSHTGLNYWPSKVGRMHRRFWGRDLLKELIDAGHKRSLDIIVYYCTIYTDWYYDNHPEC